MQWTAANLFSATAARHARCLSGLVGLMLIALACFAGPTSLGHYSFLAAGALLGFSIGLYLAERASFEPPRKAGGCGLELCLVGGTGLLLAGLAYWCGMRQFGAGDLSALIDAAWRLCNGQKPYVDFPCTLPVGFYIGGEMALRVFGIYWRSFIILNCIWICVTYYWLYALARTVLQNRLLAFWCAFTCEVITTIAVSYWWYNPVTNICAAVFAMSVVAVILVPKGPVRWLSYCSSLFLMALLKPNIAALLISGSTLILLAMRPTRIRSMIASIVALSFWFLVIGIHGSTLPEVIHGYLAVASRGFSLRQLFTAMHLPEIVLSLILLGAVLAPCVFMLPKRFSTGGPMRPVLLLVLVCCCTGMYGFITNCDIKIVDMPVLLIAAWMVVSEREEVAPRLSLPTGWARYLIFLCVWLDGVGISDALTRHRVQMVGDYGEYEATGEAFQIPFFTGVHTGQKFHTVADVVSKVVASEDMSHVFFANRLQWAYAAFHLQSPKNLPIWWDSGVSFAPQDQETYEAEWLSRRYDPVVFAGAFRMSDLLVTEVSRQYGVSSITYFDRWPSPLQILRLRSNTNAPLQPWQPHSRW